MGQILRDLGAEQDFPSHENLPFSLKAIKRL